MLLENQEGSNIIFIAGEKFHSHKLVVVKDDMEEDECEVVVKDLKLKVFKTMLHFIIYKDALIEDEELVASTSSCASLCVSDTLAGKLAAADKYGLVIFRLMCESYLCQYIANYSGVGRQISCHSAESCLSKILRLKTLQYVKLLPYGIGTLLVWALVGTCWALSYGNFI
ncbi:hypothetical protein MKX03_032797, partial [Papaver bracteatum]